MGKRTLIYSGALTLLLALSLSTYTNDEVATSSAGVVVIDMDRASISEINYESPDRDVLLTILNDEAGEYLWAEVTIREEVEVEVEAEVEVEVEVEADSDEESATEGLEETEPLVTTTEVQTTVTRFKAGATLEALIENLAPMNAKRSIEATDSLDAFGLVESFATLTVSSEDGSESIRLGGAAYRTQDRYISDTDGAIYIIDSSPLSPLTRSPRSLQDRSIFGVELSEIVGVAIASASRDSLELRQINPDDSEAAFWAREGESAGSPPIQDWVGKLLRMNAGNYVQEGEAPTSTSELLTARVLTIGGETITMSVLGGQTDEGEAAFYASSTHTRGLVMLEPSRTDNLIDDFEAVVMSPLGSVEP